jgi:hypothetical protein
VIINKFKRDPKNAKANTYVISGKKMMVIDFSFRKVETILTDALVASRSKAVARNMNTLKRTNKKLMATV